MRKMTDVVIRVKKLVLKFDLARIELVQVHSAGVLPHKHQASRNCELIVVLSVLEAVGRILHGDLHAKTPDKVLLTLGLRTPCIRMRVLQDRLVADLLGPILLHEELAHLGDVRQIDK